MGKSKMQSPFLPSEDVEGQVSERISRIDEDYVALPGSVTDCNEDIAYAAPRRSCSTASMITMCCIAAILLLGSAIVSYNSSLQTESTGHLLENGDIADSDNDFYKASHTGYHFQPEKNWMNDPNAPMYYMGYYHIFYQYNPDAAIWGNISWGHAVSTDLINWAFLEMALVPDQWYDIDGVWSGSATILKDGTPAILYTGGRTEDGVLIQSQSLALPVNYSDPLLREWRKVESNPVISPPKTVGSADFRDPTTAWLEEDGFWRIIVGSKRDNKDGTKDGMSLLYKSIDFTNWELEEHYLHEAEGTGMWECLDFFPVSVQGKEGLDHSILRAENYLDTYKYVLKASLDIPVQDQYAIGTYSTETHVFTPDDPSLDLGSGHLYDYGKFYASKTFYDSSTGRRILWSWVNESDSEKDDITKGWASVQAIPRTVWLDGTTLKNLLQWPVEEVDTLRRGKMTYQDIDLMPTEVLKVEGGDGSQLDIVIAFEKPDVTSVPPPGNPVKFDCSQGGSAQRGIFGPFGLLVHTDDAQIEQTSVFFYISYEKDGQWATRVCSDQSRSSLASGLDKAVFGSFVTVLPNENELSLRILLDHSIVETFVQGGRLAITSRVYPTVALGSKSHLFLFNNGSTPIHVNSLDVYKMSDVNMVTL